MSENRKRKRKQHSSSETDKSLSSSDVLPETEPSKRKRKRKSRSSIDETQQLSRMSKVQERNAEKNKSDLGVLNGLFNWLKQPILLLFVVTLAFLGLNYYFVSPALVQGHSMEPTLSDGDLLLVNHQSDVNRFDMIVFYPKGKKGNESDKYVKRVIGLPGDQLEYREDVLYVNNREIPEPFLFEDLYFAGRNQNKLTEDFSLIEYTGKTVIPENSFFVLGDNRKNSEDSRSFGLIKLNDIEGVVSYRLFPKATSTDFK